MENKFRLIISRKDLYKEIELNENINNLLIGTNSNCDVKFRKSSFFENIEINLFRNNKGWNIACSDNLFLSVGDVRKLITKELNHGDILFVKYQNSSAEALKIEFLIDFNVDDYKYDLAIDLNSYSSFSIGGNGCNIVVNNKYSSNEKVDFKNNNGCYEIISQKVTYGVYVNGSKIEGSYKLKNHDFITIAGVSFYLDNNELCTCSDYVKTSNGSNMKKLNVFSTHYKHPKFVRNTRVQYEIKEKELEIQQPIAKPQKPKKNLVMSLIPTIVMLAMTVVLRGIIGGGGTFVIYSAVSMGLGAIMSIVSFIQDNKTFKKDTEEREVSYKKYIEEKESEIVNARNDELRVRELIDESLDNSIAEVDSFGRRLFEKQLDDKDFLSVYLGKGTVESSNQVKFDKQEFVDLEDALSLLPEEISNKYKYIENAPIVSNFNLSNGIGISGPKESLIDMLKNITLDIAIKHFYDDVKFVYITEEDYLNRISWIRWLHNVYNEEIDARNIVCDEESKNAILESLYNTLSYREQLKSANGDVCFEQQYVVFITRAEMISTHPISKYIKQASKYGFTFVFFEEYEENIPQGCTELIRLASNENGGVFKSIDGDNTYTFNYKTISDSKAEQLAMKLAAVTVDEVSLEGELTKNITLFELFNIMSVEDIDLENNWKNAEVYKSLAAPIGVKSKNQIVSLDISDKSRAHGPHGLVAGTTGSGKSEILQTYILSLATKFHPYEVGFVIIDFKGGGMANQFKDLPHLIGTITNIDGREIDRSLLSIKAELVKRQEMFSKCGVNHINDYIKLYKNGKVSEPMPHLIMIVDEFAELKAEFPDFMKELISAARIGRTLGVHLILATQKPAGVVDAQIWSNSKFKLCLKVQTREDSNEVLKTPLAAEIVEPGRAYFQVGNNEIFELFQSAYSGADVPEGNSGNDIIYNIYEKNVWGKKNLIFTNKKQGSNNSTQTQLQAIVDYVNNYCKVKSISSLPGICLPPLKDVVSVDELKYNTDSQFISVPIGIYDDPEQQIQSQVEIDVSRDNLYIVGSSQSGKTVLLQSLIYGLMNKYDSSQVNFYLIDCGSMVLKIFENSKHVGGVVLSNEEEKCKNLFKMLQSVISDRKKTMSELGIGNYSAYLDAGYKELPLMVVVIDNMAAFKEYFSEQNDELNSITREAQSVGISFIVTASTSNALNYRTQANFGQKLVLNCNDTGEYSNVFGHCRQTPKENAGRGLLLMDKRILEFQTAIFGTSKKEAERSQELKNYINNRNSECSTSAIKIPMVPEKLILSDIISQEISMFKNRRVLPLGMSYSTVTYDMLDMNNNGTLSLVGDSYSKNQFIRSFLTMLSKTIVYHEIEITIIDDKNATLNEFSNIGFVKEYSNDVATGLSLLEDFCDEISSIDEDDENLGNKQMLIINSLDVFKRVCADKNLSKTLATLLKVALDKNAFVLIGNVENQSVGFNSSEVLKTIKDLSSSILFAPLTENKMFEISGRVKKDSVFDASMGYHFDGSTVRKIKIFE